MREGVRWIEPVRSFLHSKVGGDVATVHKVTYVQFHPITFLMESRFLKLQGRMANRACLGASLHGDEFACCTQQEPPKGGAVPI